MKIEAPGREGLREEFGIQRLGRFGVAEARGRKVERAAG
jgi:hypothetical protein